MGVEDLEEGLSLADMSTATNIKLTRKNDIYISTHQIRLRNDLLFIVGYLEFFNALDFPANVWNEIPVPTFALALMIVGGSVALLASTTAFWDLHKSYRNLRLLREERAFLHRELQSARSEGSKRRQIYLMAWLNHNFRELGWEVIDRFCMDAFCGFGAILVGTGTIMATAGANPKIYLASNLLSGYIGNGFVAFYGLFNASWSVYSFFRARKHKQIVREHIPDLSVRRRGVHVFRNHQAYASIDGITMVVSSAGSLISATMWWGYVILIPCIASSAYCNYLWRKKVGYTRILSQFKSSQDLEPDVYQQILDSINVQDLINSKRLESELSKLSQAALLELVSRYELSDDVCIHLANEKSTARVLGIRPSDIHVDVRPQDLEAVDREVLLTVIKTCFEKIGFQHVLDRERMLFEYLGSFVTFEQLDPGQDSESTSAVAEKAALKFANNIPNSPSSGPPQQRGSDREDLGENEKSPG